jgi:hypothetical protein
MSWPPRFDDGSGELTTTLAVTPMMKAEPYYPYFTLIILLNHYSNGIWLLKTIINRLSASSLPHSFSFFY